jgi:DNA polymerase delta subunit 3
VTREEPVWESFSEDEPEQSKRKPAILTTAKQAKGGNRPGQGNIMSFFGKK